MNRTTAAEPSAHLDQFARQHLPPADQWPDLVFDLPELQYPARLNCVAEILDKAVAGGGGGRLALRGDGIDWTYAELQQQVDRIVNVLRGPMGLVPGNRVLLRGANHPMMAAAVLAVLKAGLIAVPTMPLLRARELGVIMQKAQVQAVLCAHALREEIEAAPGRTGRRQAR
jgi:2-aminobenzoate-CoA ligase